MAKEQVKNNVGFTAKPSLLEAVGAEVLEERDPKAIARASLDYLNRYLRAETSFIALRSGSKLSVVAAAGPHARRLSKSKFATGDLYGDLLRREPRAIIIPDILAASVPGEDDTLDRLVDLGARSILMVAIGDVGLIVLVEPEPDVFTSFDEAGVIGIAAQLNYVVGSIYRERELEGTVDKLKTLLQAIGKGQAAGDLREALQTIVGAIIDRTGSDNGSFLLLDKATGSLVLSAAVGIGNDLKNVEIGPGQGISGWVALNKKPLKLSDVKEVSIGGNGLGRKTAAALSLPVMSGKELIGVLNLGSKKADHQFDLDDLDHLTLTLARIAVAIAAERRKDRWQALFFETVKALSRVIESRNPFSLGHSADVARVAKQVAKALKLSSEQIDAIELAGLLHDVGVAAFTQDVLGQERPLNSAERLILRSHPTVGKNALAEIDWFQNVLPIILHHHENFDGTGYVDGLEGERIPLGARILAVVEAYVAMTGDRPHRAAKSHEESIEALRAGIGTQFDPQIVEVFCGLNAAKL